MKNKADHDQFSVIPSGEPISIFANLRAGLRSPLGLSWLLVIMEAAWVMTGKTIYRDMTQFWGKLFGINFALGVATGLTLEFQFGTNWAYYSHYVGDIFGAPLAIEGLMAFFLESTMVGLLFFGW